MNVSVITQDYKAYLHHLNIHTEHHTHTQKNHRSRTNKIQSPRQLTFIGFAWTFLFFFFLLFFHNFFFPSSKQIFPTSCELFVTLCSCKHNTCFIALTFKQFWIWVPKPWSNILLDVASSILSLYLEWYDDFVFGELQNDKHDHSSKIKILSFLVMHILLSFLQNGLNQEHHLIQHVRVFFFKNRISNNNNNNKKNERKYCPTSTVHKKEEQQESHWPLLVHGQVVTP